MKKPEVYEELKKELVSHHMNLSWIMRCADNNKDLQKIHIFLTHKLVEINKLIKILEKGNDISDKNIKEFIKELTDKTIF